MTIIAIFGYKGSGKSVVANRFETRGYTRWPVAAPLKNMLKTLGLTDEQVYGDDKEKSCDLLGGKTPRWAMQSLGTEWGRECIDPDVWTRAWVKTLPTGDVVVDDLRFPNEARLLLGLGAYFIRVDRPGTTPTGELHRSEAYVDRLPFDVVFDNNDSITHLRNQVDNFVPCDRDRGGRYARFGETIASSEAFTEPTPQLDPDTCANCRFAGAVDSVPDMDAYRLCRRHAPTRNGSSFGFPLMGDNDWCGDHGAK